MSASVAQDKVKYGDTWLTAYTGCAARSVLSVSGSRLPEVFSTARMPKVLLFGTSGNPPTGRDGHSGMVEYFVNLGVCAQHVL